jgi:hypothetical protein
MGYTAYDFNEEEQEEIQEFKTEYPDTILKCKFCGIISIYANNQKIKKLKCNNEFTCGKKGGLEHVYR